MADTKDIEPKEWRAEREIASEDAPQEIISNLLYLQSCLSTYVSIEDMEKMTHAKEAFDSGRIDIDELLVFIQEARQNAEDRQTIRKRSREDLQQTLSRILAKTASWPSPLKSGIKKRCETDQSWLDRMCDKAASGQTAGELATRIEKELKDIEGRIKNLNDYFEFAEKNAKLLEEPTDIPHFHDRLYVSAGPDWISKIKAIEIYDTHDWVLGGHHHRAPKCEELGCPSHGKPHSHIIDAREYDVEGRPCLLLCHNSNCEFKHAHPRLSGKCQFTDSASGNSWCFDLSCNQNCDCIKHYRRPNYMPEEAEAFEHPILA